MQLLGKLLLRSRIWGVCWHNISTVRCKFFVLKGTRKCGFVLLGIFYYLFFNQEQSKRLRCLTSFYWGGVLPFQYFKCIAPAMQQSNVSFLMAVRSHWCYNHGQNSVNCLVTSVLPSGQGASLVIQSTLSFILHGMDANPCVGCGFRWPGSSGERNQCLVLSLTTHHPAVPMAQLCFAWPGWPLHLLSPYSNPSEERTILRKVPKSQSCWGQWSSELKPTRSWADICW